MKLNFLKNIEYEDVAQRMLRVMVLIVVAFYLWSITLLPEENDEYFEVNLAKKYDYEIEEDDVLYSGEFELIKSDNSITPVTLPTKVVVPPNEKLSVRSILPDDYKEDYIVIRSSQENVTIFIDGTARVIYNTEHSRPFGSQTTSRYVFCRTSAKDAGKELRITVSSPSEEYSCRVNEVYAGDRFIIWKYFFQKSMPNIILGFTVIAIGLFVIAIGVSVSLLMKLKTGLENAGWCIVFVGTWVVGESKIRQLLTPNASSLSNICFLVIMIGAIPMLLYMNYLQGKRYAVIYRTITTVAFLNAITQIILQLLDVFDFLDMLYVSHIVFFISVIVGIVLIYIDAKKGLIAEYHSMVVGLIAMLVCLFLEAGSVYFVNMVSGVFMMFGVVVFSFCAMFNTIERYKAFERVKQEERLRAQKEHSDSMTMQMIKTLSDTLEAKDEYTKGHSYRVAEYSVLIAKKLGLPEKEIDKLHYAASLHDIGKIGVPDTILNKPSRLTNDEYAIIKTHTVIGADIIKGIDLIAYTEEVARYHHERYDGKGYPTGLSGENIPFYARIVAVADSYDAMSSKRIYRKSLSEEIIRGEIEKNKGLQFDPQIADAFLELFDAGELAIPEEPSANKSLIDSVDIENVTEASQMFSKVVDKIKTSAEDGSFDFLTGLMLRNKGESVIGTKMQESTGALIFFDMDNLKKVNDLYGHKNGDRALTSLGESLNSTSDNITSYRAGGDEFVTFYGGATKEEATNFISSIINDYAEKQAGDAMLSQTSLSVGAYMTSAGDSFEDAMSRADKALYHVKKSGKNGYSFYRDSENNSSNTNQIDLENLISAIKTAGTYSGSLSMEYREFAKFYEYIIKVCKRYEHTCNLVLITLDTGGENTSIDDIEYAMESMGIAIKENVRNVDVCTRYSSVQYLVILLEAGESNIDMVMQRVFARYYKICKNNKCIPSYQVGNMRDE